MFDTAFSPTLSSLFPKPASGVGPRSVRVSPFARRFPDLPVQIARTEIMGSALFQPRRTPSLNL